MTAMQWIVGILLLISALILVVSVLLQSSESSGIGAVSGAAETFFGKNKAKGMEAGADDEDLRWCVRRAFHRSDVLGLKKQKACQTAASKDAAVLLMPKARRFRTGAAI